MGLYKPKCWLQIPNLKQHMQAQNESAHELSRKILHKAHIKSHIQQWKFSKKKYKGKKKKKKHITQCKEALGLEANHMGLT